MLAPNCIGCAGGTASFSLSCLSAWISSRVYCLCQQPCDARCCVLADVLVPRRARSYVSLAAFIAGGEQQQQVGELVRRFASETGRYSKLWTPDLPACQPLLRCHTFAAASLPATTARPWLHQACSCAASVASSGPLPSLPAVRSHTAPTERSYACARGRGFYVLWVGAREVWRDPSSSTWLLEPSLRVGCPSVCTDPVQTCS